MLKGIRRSENLFDLDAWLTSCGATYTKSDGVYTIVMNDTLAGTTFYFSDSNATASISGVITNVSGSNAKISLIALDGSQVVQNAIGGPNSVTKTENRECAGIRFSYGTKGTFTLTALMLNYGQTALPYEPYGDIPKDITRIAMKGASLLNPDTQWLPLKVSAGVYQGTITQFYTLEFKIPQSLVGKTVTARCYIDGNLSGTNIRWRFKTGSTIQDSKSISSSGYITLTFTCLTASDTIRVYYGSAGNRTVTITEFMLNEGSSPLPYEPYGMQPGWEVRDNQGAILWAADKTLTGTDSIPIKGYGLSLTDYKVEADMTVPATQEYSIEGTSSIDYQSDGTALTDLEFQGNMVQSGTPSSSSPIYPSEMGDKTVNLWDYLPVNSTLNGVTIVNDNGVLKFSGTCDASANFQTTRTIPAGTYTISANANRNPSSDENACIQVLATDLSRSAQVNNNQATTGYKSLTLPSEKDCQLRIRIQSGVNYDGFELRPMMNTGSSPLPFEPYGKYKIPFSNGQTSYNVYLTEPLRKIGDYADRAGMVLGGKRKIICHIFDGTETGLYKNDNSLPTNYMYYLNLAISPWKRATANSSVFCSHLPVIENAYSKIGITGASSNGNIIYMNFGADIMNAQTSGNTVEGLKEYLAAQYAAGTPVTVWYVLATEQSEPLTFPTVTPAQGANTLSVSTTLAPSKTRLTATSGVWPKNPIWPAEFGELVESGEHAGQFKIPITCGGNTYNVFTTAPLRKIGSYADYEQLSVGEGRKIVKLVLTGTETGWTNVGGQAPFKIALSDIIRQTDKDIVLFVCTHYLSVSYNSPWSTRSTLITWGFGTTYNEDGLRVKDTSCADLNEFKAFLAQEYAAGTPVTIWYVLATEQTTPTQLPTITPTDGNDTFAVNTTVPPSAVTITGHVKARGT